ncbi:hypothetical protein [Naumannella halotolerans]|uniref:Dolichyl-phosphate-mannose-protein mannosyltransferase n=1 Tax=Naumannella halotolerans TaxID=993414 RepID=A0A4R7J7X5_9ACTN|nr:hypothetical protein [Naumannella halotolerans]TDT33365.1 hypothetical protein CLV29_0976 [Naumannella halotolerans]
MNSTAAPLAVAPADDLPGGQAAAGGRIWQVVAAGAVLVALLVNLIVAWSAEAPSFPFDEISQLQMSRMLAGLDTPAMRGAGYYPGWSVLLTPLWWITDDPGFVYRASIFIGVGVAMLTIWPLSRLVAMLGLGTAQAVTVAAIVMTMPSRALQSDYAMSEKLLFLLVVCTFLISWRLWLRPRWQTAVLLSLTVAAVLFTHARMLPLVGAAVIWMLLFVRRNWKIALVGLLTLVPLAYLAQLGGSELNEELIGSFTQGEGALQELRDSRPSLFVRVALGQAWIQVVGSLGLILVGFVGLAVMLWKELRRFTVGPGGWLIAGTVATWLVSLMSWAKDDSLFSPYWPRLDAWIYGRYVDPVTAVVVAVGLAMVVRGLTNAGPILASLIAALTLFVPVYFWLAPQAYTWGYVTPAHIPGAMPWYWALPTERFPEGSWILPTLTNENRFWLIPMLCTLLVLVVIMVFRRWTKAMAVGLSVTFAAASLVANQASDHFQQVEGDPGQVVAAVDEIEAEYGPVSIGYDRGCPREGFYGGVGQMVNSYWVLPTVVTEVDREQQTVAEMDVDLVLSCDDGWPEGRAEGALRYKDATDRYSVIWVLPGAVQDGLLAEGRVD